MPTYEYRCKECSHEFEAVQAFTDDALTECPKCHGPLRKVFGNVGISFKGSGFYKTDHGSKAKSSAGSSNSSSESSSSSSDSASKSESSSTKSESSSTKSDSSSSSSSSSAA
jgi:putative FmdB family regulatory protein